MRYLVRSKVYEKVELSKNAKKVYIFCEGDTEVNYFKYFRDLSSNIDIIPISNVEGKSDPLKLRDNAELLFLGNKDVAPKFSINEEYNDEVWFVIDTDRWNEGNKIDELKMFCVSKNVKFKQWIVAQSNPSFELWLYYHFFSDKPDVTKMEVYVSFKDFVNSSIKGGFDSRSMPVELEVAIHNAKMNCQLEYGQPIMYATEVFSLGEVILPFVKVQLDKAKEMMIGNTNASTNIA